MTAPVEPRADLPALTGARGLAAWLVVLYHIRLSAGGQIPAELSALFAKGYLAVDFFFLLSGFVIFLNYGARLREKGAGAVPHFLARRIARIWPLHLVILSGAVAFALALWATGRHDPARFPWNELPLHLLLVHNWGLTEELSWNDPSWSISGEWAAYLLFPLLALAVDWRRLPSGALLLLAGLAGAALHLVFVAAGGEILDHQVARLGIFRAVLGFAAGIWLGALWQRHCADGTRPARIAALSLALIALLWGSGRLEETLAAPAALGALLLLIAFTAGARRNPLGSGPIHYLGQISYSTYLVHFLGFVAFKLAFVEGPGEIALPLLGLFLALTLAASILLYHSVERPAQRGLNRAFDQWLRRFADRRRRARPAG